jgi:hypothetical protein
MINMKLIAVWSKDQDPSLEDPRSVSWENGRTAVISDYHEFALDTHFLMTNDAGELEQHIFLDIEATVAFEANVQDWVVRGKNVIPTSLDLKHPTASDLDIIAALYMLPTVYKATIIRSLSAVSVHAAPCCEDSSGGIRSEHV